jgi:hypothetical protein
MSIQAVLLHEGNMEMQTSTVPRPASRDLIVAAAIAILVLMSGAGIAEPQTTHSVKYQGRVLEVYADKAIVEVKGRRFLVEPIAPGEPFPAAVGSEIRIVGSERDNVLIPSRIVLPSGAVVDVRPLPGNPMQPATDNTIESQLAALGIKISSRPYRRRNHTVVAGQDQTGSNVIALFDHNLRLVEIEDADHRHIHPSSSEALPESEILSLLAKQGYTSIRLLDRSRFRFLYAVLSPLGERMELHVDRGGKIVRRVWLR